MSRLFLVIVMAALVAVPSARALQVSIAPYTLDIGDMLPGESKYVEFFVVSDHDSDLLVGLSSRDAFRSFFNPDKARWRYGFVAENASEEDISGWVTFMDDSLVVPPEKTLQYLEQGGAAYANKKTGMIIEVPTDAEPGYHAGIVSPYPRTNAQGSGTSLGIIQVAEMNYVVNVLGSEASRDAEIAGAVFSKEGADRGTLALLVKNTGTVTLDAVADSVNLTGREGVVAELSSPETTIPPGKVAYVKMPVSMEGMEGSYDVDAHVEWQTGETSFLGSVNVGEYVPAISEVTGNAGAMPVSGFPMWMLPVIIGVIGALVYWRFKQ
jgi:hypothetical protein